MVHCRAREVAEHVGLWRRRVFIGICCEDDVPKTVEIVELGSPKIVGIRLAWRRVEDELGLGIVPVSVQHKPQALKGASEYSRQILTPVDCDVGIEGEGHIIPAVGMSDDPSIARSASAQASRMLEN